MDTTTLRYQIDQGLLLRGMWSMMDEGEPERLCAYAALFDRAAWPVHRPPQIPYWMAKFIAWMDVHGSEEEWLGHMRRLADVADHFEEIDNNDWYYVGRVVRAAFVLETSKQIEALHKDAIKACLFACSCLDPDVSINQMAIAVRRVELAMEMLAYNSSPNCTPEQASSVITAIRTLTLAKEALSSAALSSLDNVLFYWPYTWASQAGHAVAERTADKVIDWALRAIERIIPARTITGPAEIEDGGK